MSDRFAAWSVAASPLTVEYSLIVIEEIRHSVAEGFQRLSRGGIEVGGILYGTHDDQTVRVLAMRPIACEHARGPGFLLSDKDRKALNEQLVADADDPHLQGLVSVGWFLSHTRSEIILSESDLELYSIFFPAPWQVTMVVRPGRAGAMRAGFFVREPDGTIKSEQSYLEFNFPDRLAGILDRVPAPRPDRMPGERRSTAAPRPEALQTAPAVVATVRREAPLPEIAPPTFGQYLPSSPPKKKWPWLVAWALMVILALVFGLRYVVLRSSTEPISLAVLERDGQLRIEWNHSARPVTGAAHGTLVINDGGRTNTFSLSQVELTTGNFTYKRQSGDVEVRMSVQDADGVNVQEASRFVGQAPVRIDQNELSDLAKKRQDLEAAVARLTRENRAQEDKIQQLQRTIQIMQARAGNK